MEKISEEIHLRPLEPRDADFWREVVYDSIRTHFLPLNLPEDQLKNLLEFQYQAQKMDYEKNYPGASNNVILLNDIRVGRAIHSTERSDLHIIDMAILTDFRGCGIATRVLQWYFDKSRASSLPIRASVEKGNPAMRLWEHLGFKIVADRNTHFQVEWSESSENG